ncbi:MAG TPA: hypothetical protein DEB06_01740 [Phycisphaerales bacterium]|nr:hypothetical protein [Phycisphaerales bacterium]
MDCDEQHEPEEIPRFVEAARAGTHDVISGSRYLRPFIDNHSPPENRRSINARMTKEINCRLGLSITDAFCGFKAYRVGALARLSLSVEGYAFPMQFWVQSRAAGLRIRELPVRLIYNDATRTFGGPLDDDGVRLGHYRDVLCAEIQRCADRLPSGACDDLDALQACGNNAGCAGR